MDIIFTILRARKQYGRSQDAWPTSHNSWEIHQNQNRVSITDIKWCFSIAPQGMKSKPLRGWMVAFQSQLLCWNCCIICFYLNDQLKVLLWLHIGWLCINISPTKPFGTGEGSTAINAFPAWLWASEIYYKGFKLIFSKIHLKNRFIITHINERQKECPTFMMHLLSIFIVCMDSWSFEALMPYQRISLPFCLKLSSS